MTPDLIEHQIMALLEAEAIEIDLDLDPAPIEPPRRFAEGSSPTLVPPSDEAVILAAGTIGETQITNDSSPVVVPASDEIAWLASMMIGDQPPCRFTEGATPAVLLPSEDIAASVTINVMPGRRAIAIPPLAAAASDPPPTQIGEPSSTMPGRLAIAIPSLAAVTISDRATGIAEPLAVPRVTIGDRPCQLAEGSSPAVRPPNHDAIPWLAPVTISDRADDDDLVCAVVIFDSQLEEPV